MVPNMIFTIIQCILGGFLTFLTTQGELIYPWKNGFKKLTKKGKKVIGFILGILAVSLLQEWNNSEQLKVKDNLLAKEKADRESILANRMEAATDSISKALYQEISADFMEQVLRIETVNNRVLKTDEKVVEIRHGVSNQEKILESIEQKTDKVYKTNSQLNDADSPILKILDSKDMVNFDNEGNLNIKIDFANRGVRSATNIKLFYQVLYGYCENNDPNNYIAYLVGPRDTEFQHYPKTWMAQPKGQNILANLPHLYGTINIKPKLTKKDFFLPCSTWTVILSFLYTDGSSEGEKIETFNIMAKDFKDEKFTIRPSGLNMKAFEDFFTQAEIKEFIKIN